MVKNREDVELLDVLTNSAQDKKVLNSITFDLLILSLQRASSRGQLSFSAMINLDNGSLVYKQLYIFMHKVPEVAVLEDKAVLEDTNEISNVHNQLFTSATSF